jgi:malate dehydrogenase (oxaloacetate-decarboxylating)(NADP+)
MVDVDGVLYEGRENLNEFRRDFTRLRSDQCRTLQEALVDADVMMGLSAGSVVDEAMLRSMADRPIVFALANPNPEID